ncbi:MAG: DUF4190 domain-containing protein [Planctomycetota bacterium]|jgi:prepilin-type processing-associated H-X9-DG protein
MVEQPPHYQPLPPTTPETVHPGISAGGTRTGLAIAALVCGILGFCFAPLGLLGLILGIVALAKANKRPEEYGGKGIAIGGICTGGAALIIGTLITVMAVSIMLPSLARARELSRRVVCAANLSAIGKCLYVYADANNDYFPPDLNTLVQSGAISPQTLQCPSAAGPGYVYIPGLTTNASPNTPVVYEVLDNHDGEGGNILFADSHVEFYNQPKYDELIAPYKDQPKKDVIKKEEASAISSSFARGRELSRRVICSKNLQRIGQALYVYANKNQEKFPADLNILITSGALSPKLLQCPGGVSPSYMYIPGMTPDDKLDTPVAYDAIENHGEEGGNILFIDGHVEFYKKEGYERIIAPYKDRAKKVEIKGAATE